MPEVISDDLFQLCHRLEATIAAILVHPDVTAEITQRLDPLWREMNTHPTCELYGFGTMTERQVYDDDDDDDDPGERMAA